MKLTKIWLSMALMALMMLGACSGSNVEADLLEMFKNVPADATTVVCGDLGKLVDQSGGKIEDGKIQWNNKAFAGGSQEWNRNMKKLEDLSAGIEAGAFVGFYDKGAFCLVTRVKDAAVLKQAIDKEVSGAWEKSGKMEYKGSYYLINGGEYLWTTQAASPETIQGYLELSDVKSFSSDKYAATMAAASDAASLWVSLEGIYSGLSFSEQATARMAVSMLFEQPKYLTGTLNMKGNSMDFSMMPMTSEYKPAKCVIDVAKIDESVVAGLGGNADAVVALNVSQKLVKQIQDLGKSMGGALPVQMLDVLMPLDGTIAVAANNLQNPKSGYKAVITTNGVENAALSQMLSSFGKVEINGKNFTVSDGNYGLGELKVADVAKKFNGAWFGLATAGQEKGIKAVVYLMLVPEDGTLKIKLNVESSSQN